jgi:hypothetical protein
MAVNCSRPAALTAIAAVLCGIDFDQFVCIIAQRSQDVPSFATEAEMKTLAAWTPLLTAPGNTKIVKFPEFAGFTLPSSEAQFADENSNASIDGVGTYTGLSLVKPTGLFLSTPFDVLDQVRALEEESRAGLEVGLTFYFITRDGRIVHKNLAGIEIANFNVGSVGSEGYKAANKIPFSFTLPGDWDRGGLQITKPNFDIRRALKVAA